MKEIHAGRLDARESDGTVQKGWSHRIRSSYRLDADNLAAYCTDNPQFWGNYKRWLPLAPAPGKGFWIEYAMTHGMQEDRPHLTDVTDLAYHVEVSEGEGNELQVCFFHRIEHDGRVRLERVPRFVTIHLDDKGAIESMDILPEGMDELEVLDLQRELFFALLPLTVISNPDANDVGPVPHTGKTWNRHLNSKDAKKRKKANEEAKFRYWSFELLSDAVSDATMDATDERNS